MSPYRVETSSKVRSVLLKESLAFRLVVACAKDLDLSVTRGRCIILPVVKERLSRIHGSFRTCERLKSEA